MGVVFFNRPELITYNDVCMFLILSQKGLKNLAKRGYTQPLLPKTQKIYKTIKAYLP